jgi:cytochrome c-type biogenesis protein
MGLEEFLDGYKLILSQLSLIALGITFLAGISSSAVCPCTLPVGLGVAGMIGASGKQQRQGLIIGTAFFAGIVSNLTILGAMTGHLGAFLTESFGRYWALAMALISLVAAILAFGGLRLKADQLSLLRKPGIISTIAYGFIFSLGTSVAPLLLLLTIAAVQGRPGTGALLGFTFGIGRGLPFLLIGLFAGAMFRMAQFTKWCRPIGVASGFVLLFVTFYFTRVFAALL